MKKINYVITAVAGLALSGCAIADVNEVNQMRTTTAQGGTPFTRALTDEYRVQTIYEADHEYEWDDAAFFARKGQRAAKGEMVLPFDIAAAPAGSNLRHGSLGSVVHVPSGSLPPLAAAHGHLIAFLDGGGRDLQPALAARAQGYYDCWVEEEWEGDADDVVCRDEFLKLETQFKIAAAPAAAMAKPAGMGAKINTFQVFFDFDRSTISDAAAKIVRQAADGANKGQKTVIDLTGHTDASGSDAYNQALSERRAQAVKAELVKDGLPEADITSVGVGKAGQLLPTADGIREPQNRRTEIILR